MKKHTVSQQGFSLLELALAVAILSVLLLSAGFLFLKSAGAMDSMARTSHVMSRALVTLDRLEAELLTANFSSLVPPVPEKASELEFRKIVDVEDGRPVFGKPTRVRLIPLEARAPGDGLDNNGNGLVDEHGIRIWEDAPPEGAEPGPEDSATIICGNTTPQGLLFTRVGAVILIDLAVQDARPGEQPAVFKLRSAIRMRNDANEPLEE